MTTNQQHPGLFITVEGIDGVGKSTQIEAIAAYLRAQQLAVITTKDPGGTQIGDRVRQLLLDQNNQIHPITELLLLFASRQELITQVIAPNLAQGICVISDRFIDSSIAYQGYGRGLGLETVNLAWQLLAPQLEPDLTLVFDLDPQTANTRSKQNKISDRIEQENNSFFQQVREAYHNLAITNTQRVKLIDASKAISAVTQAVQKELHNLLAQTR